MGNAISCFQPVRVWRGGGNEHLYSFRISWSRCRSRAAILFGPSVRKACILTLQAQIFPENEASVALHEQQGFRRIGYREKFGKRNGIWQDVFFRTPQLGSWE